MGERLIPDDGGCHLNSWTYVLGLIVVAMGYGFKGNLFNVIAFKF